MYLGEPMDQSDFKATLNSIFRNSSLPSYDESLTNYARYRSGSVTADVLSLAWKNSDSGMVITDNDGKIVSVNTAFCAMAKSAENLLIGTGLTDIFDNTVDHTPLFSMYSRQRQRNGGAARGKHYIQFTSGGSFVADISAHRLSDDADEVFVFMEFRIQQ